MGSSDSGRSTGRHRADLSDLEQLGEDVSAVRKGTADDDQQANAQQATQTGTYANDDPTEKR